MLGLTAMFVGVGPLMVAVLNLSPDRQSMELLLPYFSAMYVILSVWTGLGLMVFAIMVAKPSKRSSPCNAAGIVHTLPQPGLRPPSPL
jgi:hypothetical protein